MTDPDQSPAAEPRVKVLARRLRALKAERTAAGRHYDQLKPEIEEAERLLTEEMLTAGDLEVTVDGYRGSANPTLWAKKLDPATTPQQIVEALLADGLPHLVTPESINWQSLSAYLRDLADEDKPIPERLAELIESTEKWGVGFTKIPQGRGRRRVAGTSASAGG
ncbi:MAG: hypothetical protein ACRDTZ_03800 [Pseudonocardiaceae bacterium]